MADQNQEKAVEQVVEILNDSEAVYYSALALLDGLPGYRERALVALNWVKYVLLHRVEEVSQPSLNGYVRAYALLCSDFSANVMELPEQYIKEMTSTAPCGECAACKAAIASKEN